MSLIPEGDLPTHRDHRRVRCYRCVDARARGLVHSIWDRLNSLIADSHVKLRLRSFGWFVLERHY
jgi:hypothetical protein